MVELDFKGLSGVLLSRWSEFLPSWCPGGKVVGREFTSASIMGGVGDSFKCNIETGNWADFATDHKGGDLISLYAKIQGIKNGEAAKRLSDQINYKLSDAPYNPLPPVVDKFQIEMPPIGIEPPVMVHPLYGEPSAAWCYKTLGGLPVFWEARYDTNKGKQFSPWSWCAKSNRWVQKGFPPPRPLYGLEELSKRKKDPVLILEGAKCAEAARVLAGNVYVPIAWSGGSNAVNKSDWEPLRDRKILIWPDADEPGVQASNKIKELAGQLCSEVKVLDVNGMPEKWDVANALSEGWDWSKLKEWAKPRAIIVKALSVVSNANGHITAAAQANVQVNINNGDETPEPTESVVSILQNHGIETNKLGVPVCNMDNVLRVLERIESLKGLSWFDTFHQKIFTNWNGDKREWSDHDTLFLTKYLQREFGFSRLSDAVAFQALTLLAHQNKRSEPRDWMETLEWDKVERIDDFFMDALGAVPSEYICAASRNFWVGMVARIYRPGCKMDNMIVLEGGQGTLKSTALHRIGGDWFGETTESVTNKDFFLIIQGKLIIEIAELHTFSKSEVTRIKQVITCQNDRYRAPYERLVSDHPRQSIFCGSTNENAYLKDNTGNRRFWPVKCGIIKPDFIVDIRPQLFAEAVHKFKDGVKWWEMPKDETEDQQEDRRQVDIWENMIADYLMGFNEIELSQIAVDCLKFEPSRIGRFDQQRMGMILQGMGWQNVKVGLNGSARKIWKRVD